ncbi:aldo/keto reductase [Bacteroidota bacterium]
MQKDNRREFLLKLSAATAAVLVPFPISSCNANKSDKWGELLPQRLLGSTGEKISMLGLGGWHFGHIPERDAQELIEAAIESGIRLFDTAEAYQDGGSEKRYGKLLAPKYREEVFLFSKTRAENAADARKHLEQTLKSLNTEYLDLWKMHQVASPEDFDTRMEGEVIEVMEKAKAEGKVRHIGFSGHRTYKAHLHILKSQSSFSTCLMPINVADSFYESFILNAMPELQNHNYGIMAMKTMGGGGLMGTGGSEGKFDPEKLHIVPNKITIEEALHFVWSLPVSTIISGVRNTDQLSQNVKAAKSFIKMDEEQRSQLIERVSDVANTGEMEWYKARI